MSKSSIGDLPSGNWRKIINEYANLIPDPVRKLKFLNNSIGCFHRIPGFYKLYSSFGEIALRKAILEEAEKLCPGSRKKAKELMREGVISRPQPTISNLYKYRHAVFLVLATVLIWGLGNAAAALGEFIYPSTYTSEKKIDKEFEEKVRLARLARLERQRIKSEMSRSPLSWKFPTYIEDPIWMVEKTTDLESYSNSLQIITTSAVENEPRRYVKFSKDSDKLPDENVFYSDIIGILYHASESDIIPLSPEKNKSIKKYSELLRRYISRKQLYHYFIDRYGRVYKIVREDHAAFHAGNSIWADDKFIYLNLNHAFIGVCFEGKGFAEVTDHKPKKAHIQVIDESIITEAQISSGKELTDWLRYKYKIPQQHCVPHGLVSVNPTKKLIGYHLDLSHGFPFHRFGCSARSPI